MLRNMMTDEKFIEMRRSGIGGSDIAGIMGVTSPDDPFHKTAYEVYEEKVSGITKDLSKNPAVRMGNLLEDPVANLYEEIMDKKLFCTNTIRHKRYPFIIANPDRLIFSKDCQFENKGLEIKTATEYTKHYWGECGSQDIPERYYLQIAHYMLVLDYPAWELAVLIGGHDFRVYTFERDKEIDKLILSAARKFWRNHVKPQIPPPIEYSNPNVQQIIRKKYTLVSEKTIDLDSSYIEIATEIDEVTREIEILNKKKNQYKAMILNAMGNAGVGELPNGRKFTRTLVKRKGYTVEDSSYVKLNLNGG